jgi:hypothetical protein
MRRFGRGAGNDRCQRGLFTNNSDLVVPDFDLRNHGAEIVLHDTALSPSGMLEWNRRYEGRL